MNQGLREAIAKIQRDGGSSVFADVFARMYSAMSSFTAVIREKDILPLVNVLKYEDLVKSDSEVSHEVNKRTAIVKLNGGLGTTMGLDRAKSLLPVKNSLTFLDFIIQGVQHLRKTLNAPLPLIFMNSFRTSADTHKFITSQYPGFYGITQDNLPPSEFIQNREPKIKVSDGKPVQTPWNPELEWCPPGHGDFYTSIYASGALKQLVDAGFKYAFVSNADNLGAVFDQHIAKYFASTGSTIMLELANKTEDDIKGGHVVLQNGKMLLREAAQIVEGDKEVAFDKEKHPYFNTNSLWLDLEQLLKTMNDKQGVLELPVIVNHKTADPRYANTEKVVQLETAIASAISIFEKTSVINVPRSRFLPVKTNDDLDNLRSDAYEADENCNLVYVGAKKV